MRNVTWLKGTNLQLFLGTPENCTPFYIFAKIGTVNDNVSSFLWGLQMWSAFSYLFHIKSYCKKETRRVREFFSTFPHRAQHSNISVLRYLYAFLFPHSMPKTHLFIALPSICYWLLTRSRARAWMHQKFPLLNSVKEHCGKIHVTKKISNHRFLWQ
jgi:hypothetical protein